MRIAIPGTNVSLTLQKSPVWRAQLDWGGRNGSHAEASAPSSYSGDGLTVAARNLAFLYTERFKAAYAAGIGTPHQIAGGGDLHIEWRVYTALWAAEHAMQLPGDFVECGVNTGILSRAICEYLDFGASSKQFYLFDTFKGIPEHQASPAEREFARSKNARIYRECYDDVKRIFAPFPNVRLVRGTVPETLASVRIDRVSYLSIDMNLVFPEIAALEHFWDRLVPGAVVVLDDYGFAGHGPQHDAVDAFAAHRGVPVYTSPTGQGLILRAG